MLHTLSGLASELVAFPIGDTPAQAVPGLEGFTKVIGGAKWVAFIICLLCLIASGVMLAIRAQDGRGHDGGAGSIIKVLIGAMIVSGAVSILGFVL